MAFANGQGTNIVIKLIDDSVGFSNEKLSNNKYNTRLTMSDAHLRKLEARYRESGTLTDEAAWLQERMRQGEVDQEMCRIAAYCGYPAAVAVLDQRADLTKELEQWVNQIPTLSANPFLALRVILAIAQSVLALYEEANPDDDRGRQAILTSLKFLYNPCNETTTAVVESSHVASEGTDIYRSIDGADSYPSDLSRAMSSHAIEAIAWAPCLAANTERWNVTSFEYELVGYCANDAAKALSVAAFLHGEIDGVSQDDFEEAKEKVKKVVCDSLASWALGYMDPLIDLLGELEATPALD